ncbi:c-type cytochrome [Roseiconus nitratireducens]|uniref:C-type cytochrome n=1 Tax=Roseiconus nitratireducens TaxID=2605748 RepID=A0A5M6DG78_9BACT|nr:cbb3-type cytochrome c oxidase N-terminal domain-containing protein [Roseiconus nitratireducens]KAA5545209.1 c-type cytochrome [Roseiconus nitratireducens]
MSSHQQDHDASVHDVLPEDHVPDDPLTGHNYDGIEEFDNPLPGWWKWLFIATIVFAFPYLAFYHGGAPGRTLADSYDRALAANMELQFAEIGEVRADAENVVKFLGKPSWLAFGKTVFKSNCTSCHGEEGGGKVGPNLTDDYYKNVKKIGDFITVMENGAGAGAMPAWKNRLSTNEIVLVSSYVASLRNTNVAGGMAPLGQEIPPWPEPPEEEETPSDQDAGSGPDNGSEETTGSDEASADAESDDPAAADETSEPDKTTEASQ